MICKCWPVLLVLGSMLTSPVTGQVMRDDPRVVSALALLERWVDAQQAYERLPGVSMAVVHDQELVWSKGFGFARLETRTAALPTTMYSICSISKLFTSIGIMQLRDRKMLRLDDAPAEHLPWFNIERADPASPSLSIRGMLTHSAGLPRESDYPYWTGPDYPFPTREEIIERVGTQRTLYPADRYYQYSNLGLTLAGEIVAAASEETYANYVRRQILDPLGMDDTNTEHRDDLRGNRLARGYTAVRRDGSREPVPAYQVRGIAPAAGFTSTVEDLARFASWQFRLLKHGGEEVLNAATLREMHRVHWIDPDWDTTRGLGFWVSRSDKKTFVGHGGYCPGYQAHFRLQPEDAIATIFMTNTNGLNSAMYTQRAYEIMAPVIRETASDPGGGVPPNPAFAKYVGRYDDWLAGEEHVIPWKGGLAIVYLPTADPMNSLIVLEHVEGHTFRRRRDDGTLGEAITFEMGPDGMASRVWRHSNYARRVW